MRRSRRERLCRRAREAFVEKRNVACLFIERAGPGKERVVNTGSIAGGATAAIFAAISVIGYAQTGWHPATQGDKSMGSPGATSGELNVPKQDRSAVPGMSGHGATTPDKGVKPPRRKPAVPRRTDSSKPKTDSTTD
jgi:hypothetical protein